MADRCDESPLHCLDDDLKNSSEMRRMGWIEDPLDALVSAMIQSRSADVLEVDGLEPGLQIFVCFDERRLVV